MNFENGKTLGGVGAILMFVGIIPVINTYGIIELAGLILVMIALYNYACYYSEKGIFNSALYGLIAGIVGGAVAVGAIILSVLTSLTDFLYMIFPNWNGDWSTLSGLTPDPTNVTLEAILPFVTGILAALLVLWAFSIIATFFIRRSLISLSAKSGISMFSTAGLIMLIGAVLIIAFGLGLILIWVSALLLAIAFFQMKPPQAQAETSSATTS